MSDRFLGPVVLPIWLAGATYLNFLQNTMGDSFKDISRPEATNVVLACGTPGHFWIAIREYLQQTFPSRWVRRGNLCYALQDRRI